jgi:hypothetical protein
VVVLALLVVPALAWAAPPPTPVDRIAALEAAVAKLKTSVAGLQTTVSTQAGQIGDLTRRVGSVEAVAQPQYETVYCAQGQTVTSVLNRHWDHAGPLTITIVGVCTERVEILRGDVTLQGASEGDGLASSSSAAPLMLTGVQGIVLRQLTIRGGPYGIFLARGSSLQGYNVKVEGVSVHGIEVDWGSSAFLYSSVIADNPGTGVSVHGVVTLESCEITRNLYGVDASMGGTVYLSESTVSHNERTGILLFHSGTVAVSGGRIEYNGQGVDAVVASSIDVANGNVIGHNTGPGVSVSQDSTLNMRGDSEVSSNGGPGVVVSQASTVVGGGSIRGNTGDGIALQDMSSGCGGGIVISDNAGYGIYCGAPEPIRSAQSGYNWPSITFSGNEAGDTNCPRN